MRSDDHFIEDGEGGVIPIDQEDRPTLTELKGLRSTNKTLKAENQRLRGLVREVFKHVDASPELNMANCDEWQVADLNGRMIVVHEILNKELENVCYSK